MNAPRPGRPAAGGVSSPCVEVCRIGAGSSLCEGCLRTLDEISEWSMMDDDAKLEVWRRIEWRRARASRGGS